jgi:hypothetical protein
VRIDDDDDDDDDDDELPLLSLLGNPFNISSKQKSEDSAAIITINEYNKNAY